MRKVVAAGLMLAVVALGCGDDSTPPDGSMTGMDGSMGDAGTPGGGVDAGDPGCASDAECDDGVDCTEDRCTEFRNCRNTVLPSLCPTGSSCHPTRGCEMGRPCADDTDCVDDDACTVNERCDPAARVCVVDPLDGDGDGDPPRVCGGGDCDDSVETIFAGADERCNTADDDCDGRTDEGLEAPVCTFCETVNSCGDEDMHGCYVRIETHLELTDCANRTSIVSALADCATASCTAYPRCRDMAGSSCECPDDQTFCGDGFFGSCVDTAVDRMNCGSCGRSCPSGTTCDLGDCACPAGLILCGSFCVDASEDVSNCGACGRPCPFRAACVAGDCECPAGESACDGECLDTTTDDANCGSCGHTCSDMEFCEGGACVACGGRNQPCCSGVCERGLTCGTDVPGGLCIANDVCYFPRPAGSCPPGQACFVSIAAGFAFCAERTGSLPQGSACTTYTECENGLVCTEGRCQRVCYPLESGRCPGLAMCPSASWGACCGGLGFACCGSSRTCFGRGVLCSPEDTCACPPGATVCGDGTCADLDSDEMNCGACGRTCAAMQNCIDSECVRCGEAGGACCRSAPHCDAGFTCSRGACRPA